MNSAVLSSTFLLTLLLAVGLFFFIRASVKDRTEQVQLLCDQSEESVLTQLQQYFQARAYQMTAVDPQRHQLTFEGYVKPSWFLAVFLTALAAIGMLCLALVLMILFPSAGPIFLSLILLAPVAGIFYWQRAGRVEAVSIQVQPETDPTSNPHSLITLKAHRDEIAELLRAVSFKPVSVSNEH